MGFSSWRGTLGMVHPTLRPGSTEEFIRLAPEGIGVLPMFLNISRGTRDEFEKVFAAYEGQIKVCAEAGCDLITITQYLRPTAKHHPVERWVKPNEFVEISAEAEAIGFAGVMSGPLVRSSYRAGRLFKQAQDKRTTTKVTNG